MASSSASLLLHPLPPARAAARCLAGGAPTPQPHLHGRRQCLLLLALPPSILAWNASARAEDIPLFGLRKRLKRIEEAAEVIVKEGEKAVEEGIEAAEKGIQAAEKRIQAAEVGISAEAAGFTVAGDLVQAGAVAAAEAVGVLVGLSVVNGILGPDVKKSQY